jgi:hypothetical protein
MAKSTCRICLLVVAFKSVDERSNLMFTGVTNALDRMHDCKATMAASSKRRRVNKHVMVSCVCKFETTNALKGDSRKARVFWCKTYVESTLSSQEFPGVH